MQLTEQDYLNNRVDDQINWYEKKCAWHKKWFMRLKISETILALMVPFLTGYITTENVSLKFLVGFIGLLVAAIANLITLFKFQEVWIEYRTTSEALKHEKYLYVTQAGPYKESNAFASFVERIEDLLNKENANWASYIKYKENEKNVTASNNNNGEPTTVPSVSTKASDTANEGNPSSETNK
jgi:hypothetical protein